LKLCIRFIVFVCLLVRLGKKVVVRYVGYTSYKYTAYHVKNSITGMESILLCLKQEAQLSQRDRATLRVIKYFAKSLKVTEGHSK